MCGVLFMKLIAMWSHACVVDKYLNESPFGAKVELVVGTGLQYLQQANEPFDMIFIDADKETQIEVWSNRICGLSS